MTIKRSNPDAGGFPPEQIAAGNMSGVVRVGDTVYLSGLVGVFPDGSVAEGMKAQIVQIFEILRNTLRSENMDLSNLVSAVLYTPDMPQMMEITPFYLDHFKDGPPVSTYIECKGLASPRYLVEIVFIAAEK